MLILKFSPKNPRKNAILMGFLLIMKENDYYNIHKKFQVHNTSIFGLGAKIKIGKWQQPPSTPNFHSLPYPNPTSR